ncbi:MAG: sodium pump decarboxylase subunit gamma [Desulfovibrionaceae bacterium]|jgi:sodium pump decarboxylase gamma subunit|nr:sodium pump decarboxylase subunit gamma [Desulfovibrionaceae bacterium]
MIVTELLASFANPDVMQSLSTSDKLLAGLITTILGMGITFSALVILQFIISWMDKILNNSRGEQTITPATVPIAEKSPDAKEEVLQDDNELVAVIASVIAMKMKTSVENIVIKNIEKLDDRSPAWNRAGIVEQMNSRL